MFLNYLTNSFTQNSTSKIKSTVNDLMKANKSKNNVIPSSNSVYQFHEHKISKVSRLFLTARKNEKKTRNKRNETYNYQQYKTKYKYSKVGGISRNTNHNQGAEKYIS